MTTTTPFVKKYKVIQKIGEGSFSEVLKCQDRENGTLYAAKRLKKIYQTMDEMLESPEVIAMRKITHHPNILYMIESHYNPKMGIATLIFELMDMSLYDLIKMRKGRTLTEQRIKVFLYQLFRGLDHLHSHGLFHRDIKPENILIKGDIVKLADFGSIRGIYSVPPYTEYISTRWYRSPECLLTTGFYGPKMDVWAIGCVYYELLTLKPLFPGCNEVDQLSKIHTILGTPHARLVAKFRRHKARNCEYFFPNKEGTGLTNLLPHVSENGRDVLKLMLVYDPENRSNVRRLLDHRYFNDLREKASSPRQSNSVILPNAIGRENAQWRNPVLLSYITSERRRKSKAPRTRRSSKSYDDDDAASKIPRAVASSPNPRPSLTNRCTVSRFEKTSNETAVDTTCKKIDRVWRNNRVNTARTDNRPVTKTQSTNKFPSITKNYSLKSTVSRESSNSLTPAKKDGVQRVASLSSQRSYCGFALQSDPKSNLSHQRETPFCNSFLPQVALRSTGRSFHRFPVASTGSTANQYVKSFPSNMNLRQTKLATINEQQHQHIGGKIRSKSPQTKSPAKKMAKHEIHQDSRQNLLKKLKTCTSKVNVKHDRITRTWGA